MGSESVDSWLSRIQLGQYTGAFEKAGFRIVSQCHGLDEQKLLRMGIFLAGHIKRILAHLPPSMEKDTAKSCPPADHPYENLGFQEERSNSDQSGIVPPSLPPKGAAGSRKVQLSDLEKAQSTERPQPRPRKSLSRGSLTSTGSKSNESLSKVSTGSRSNDSSPSSEVKTNKPIPRPRARTPRQMDKMVSIEGVTATESSDADDNFPIADGNNGKVPYFTGNNTASSSSFGHQHGPKKEDVALPLPSLAASSAVQVVDPSKSPTDTESTPEDNTDDSGIYEQVWQMQTVGPVRPERQRSPEELIKFETPKDLNRKFEFGDHVLGDRASTASFDMPPPMFDPPPLPLGPLENRNLPPVPPRVLPSPTPSTLSSLSGSAVNPFQETDPFADFETECARFNEANLGAASSAATQYQLSRGDMSRGFASAGQPAETLFHGTQGGSAASSTQRPDSCVYMFDPLIPHRAPASAGPQGLLTQQSQTSSHSNSSRLSMTYGPFDPFGLENKSISDIGNSDVSVDGELPAELPSANQGFDPFNLSSENVYSEMDKEPEQDELLRPAERTQRLSDSDTDSMYQNAEVIQQQGQAKSLVPAPDANSLEPQPDLMAIPPSPYPRGKPATAKPVGGATAQDRGVYSVADLITNADGPSGDVDHSRSKGSPEKASEKRIPILRNTSIKRTKERSGYLHKQGGVQNNKGWRRRWVIFNGEDIRYYADNKTCVSKKILPVSCMTNVVNDIKMEDNRKYRFKLVTSNRVYIFATDTLEENHLWSSTIMEAILKHKPPPDGVKKGGKMHSPDKEGFVKLDSRKNKCFIVIKKDILCYYNNYEDFCQACAVNEIQMKLASVKELNHTKLQLSTHYSQFVFTFDSSQEMLDWKIAMEDAIAEGLADDTVLKKVMTNGSNQWCADCLAPKPHWAAVNLGIVLCKKCAGIHRELGPGISRVKSLRMDTKIWTPSLIALIVAIGNENANNFWEFDTLPEMEITDETPAQLRKQHIEEKYKQRKFCRLHPKHANKTVLNQELLRSAETDDILKSMQILFSGAEILYHRPGGDGETAFEIAKSHGQSLQMELLYQNGGDKMARVTDSPTFLEAKLRSTVCQQGFLYKTGSNRKDFLRRWCQLEHGSLSYFMDDKTTTAKDSVSYDSMLSIFTTSVDKYPYSFELSTTKPGNRLFLFAADIVEDRLSWIQALAKCFCPVWLMEQVDNYDFSFCGYVYLKEGLTQEWNKSWMMLSARMLYFTSELIEPDQLQEVDLRKVLHIRLQDNSTNHLCLEAGPCLVIDAGRSVYIQLDLQRDTDKLHSAIQLISSNESHRLDDQQLTTNNIPVIVEKCITHIELHGINTEGVYRQSGTHSKITKLLEAFRKDARALVIRTEDYTVHEVANCLKRYFRSLEDPLLTNRLYSEWVDKAAIGDQATKIQWYQYLLGQLPVINKATLKKIIHHLVNVSQHEEENKMGVPQLASIFGPALMTLDSALPPTAQGGFGYTNREISLLIDMLQFHAQLFEMDKSELETKQKMERAMEKLKALSSARPVSTVDSGFIMPVYVDNPQGDCVTLQVTVTMKVEELVNLAKEKKKLQGDWVLHECVCDGTLERPLNDQARVFTVTQEWQDWDEEYRKGVCLCLKVSDLIQTMHSLFEFHSPLFGEFRFSEKKAYKKYWFGFKQSKLTCYKDVKATNKIGEWEVEKLSIFHGVERRRNPPTEFGFTFIVRGEKIKKSRDMPFFGRSVACASREEAVNWMAGLYKAQYPNGFHS